MKPSIAKEIIKSCKDRGYVEIENCLYPPNSPQVELLSQKHGVIPKNKNKRLHALKTGWTDDYRNIRNKEKHKDQFIMLLNIEFPDLQVWPEFYFSTERDWRIDYFIPELLLAIEQEGGVWSGGRHTRGKGFIADMEKYNTISSKGWTLIRRTPAQMCTQETLNIIKSKLLKR